MLNLAGRVLQDSIWPFGRRWSILPVTGRLSELDLQPEKKNTYRTTPSRKSKQHLYTLYYMHTCIYHFHTGMCWLSKYMNKDMDRALHLIHIDMRQAGMELGWFKNGLKHELRFASMYASKPSLITWQSYRISWSNSFALRNAERRLDASSLQSTAKKKALCDIFTSCIPRTVIHIFIYLHI